MKQKVSPVVAATSGVHDVRWSFSAPAPIASEPAIAAPNMPHFRHATEPMLLAKRPGPQRLQLVCARSPWDRPGAHKLHLAVPALGAMAPAAHISQLDAATAPSKGFDLPGWHAWHATEDAFMGLNRPTVQLLQRASALPADTLCLPAGHATQMLGVTAPCHTKKYPALQR